jgi:hypothetical protein
MKQFVVWWNTDDGQNREGDRAFAKQAEAQTFFDMKCREDGIEIVEMYDYAASSEHPIVEWCADVPYGAY